MGYYSNVTGEIRISPPIAESLIDMSTDPSDNHGRGWWDVRLKISEENTLAADGGTAIRRVATAIVADREDTSKFYYLKESLALLAPQIHATGAVCVGELVRWGEENGDVERFRIMGDRVETDMARLTWSDGTEVKH
jgi:hypothetical protein